MQALAASMLAGAGVIGIVLGVAAGPLIGNPAHPYALPLAREQHVEAPPRREA